jgi:hypothetical protein
MAVETPDFAKEVEKIPDKLKGLITKYELVWTLTIDATYEQRRRWDEFLAVREILQNALDAEHEAVGYDDIAVKLEIDQLGTWIRDRGKGITYKAFILGGEEKSCELRGAYGEGLKISLLWFASRGYPIHFFTRGNKVFSCYYSAFAGAPVIIFGRSGKDTMGTHVLLQGYTLRENLISQVYYKAANLKTLCKFMCASSRCAKDMPNLILLPGGSLYVRDIYVNQIKDMIGKRSSFFSYNLWWVELEPNRVMVNSAWQLKTEVARILGSCPVMIEVIKACLEEDEFGGSSYYKLRDDYYELRLDFTDVKQAVLEGIRKLMRDYNITAYSEYGDFGSITAVAHEGGICVLVPPGTFPLFKLLPPASDFVIKELQTLAAGAKVIDERILDAYLRGHLRIWREWVESIPLKVKIQVVDGDRSFYRDDLKTVFMSKYDLEAYNDQAAIHEIAHAYGYARYGTALHLTENFEKALAEVGQHIYNFMVPFYSIAMVHRANSGCIHAEPKSYSEFFGELADILPESMRVHLIRDPTMFIVIAEEDGKIGVVSSSSVLALMPYVEERYQGLVKERIKALKSIRELLLLNQIDVLGAARELKAKDLAPELNMVLDKKRLKVYVYDIEKDKYIYLETIQ